MIEIVIEDTRWDACDLAGLAARAEAAVLARLDLPAELAEMSLLACDDARIAELNGEFRDRAQPTNVLSWPDTDLSAPDPGAAPSRPKPDAEGNFPLGDIALSYDTCMREAAESGTPADHHVLHLVAHGILHLLGYDHVNDDDAARMEAIEIEILSGLDVGNPYIVADGA